MKLEEIIAKLQQDGKTEEELKAELGLLKQEICEYLGEDKDAEKENEEENEEKIHEVFGI